MAASKKKEKEKSQKWPNLNTIFDTHALWHTNSEKPRRQIENRCPLFRFFFLMSRMLAADASQWQQYRSLFAVPRKKKNYPHINFTYLQISSLANVQSWCIEFRSQRARLLVAARKCMCALSQIHDRKKKKEIQQQSNTNAIRSPKE